MRKIAMTVTMTLFLFAGFLFKPLYAQEPEHPSLFFKSEDITSIKKNIHNSECGGHFGIYRLNLVNPFFTFHYAVSN